MLGALFQKRVPHEFSALDINMQAQFSLSIAVHIFLCVIVIAYIFKA